MNSRCLIARNLVHHRRTHIAVVCGAAVCTAVLTGALLVGDSVRESLIDLALTRLGRAAVALDSGERLFRAALADELADELDATVAPLLRLRGVALRPDGAGLRCAVDILGVDERFFRFWEGGAPPGGGEGPVINAALAERLDISPGGDLLLRVAAAQPLPGEAPLSRGDDLSLARRFTLRAVAPDDGAGRFSLLANQAAPLNVFLPLSSLGELAGAPGKANLMLAGIERDTERPVTPERAGAALRRTVRLADLGLEVRTLSDREAVELRSERLFLSGGTARAAAAAGDGAVGVLTYFVNDLAVGDRHTPYSFVTALGPLGPGGGVSALFPGLAGALDEGTVAVNEWLAEDLDARPGETLFLTSFVFAPGRRLEERTVPFTIGAILPLAGAAADPGLMPPYPGLAEGESCSDWEPGVAVDLDRIRPKDEEYWERHRGTPKAFLPLEAGRALWGSRFGALTAVRYPAKAVTPGGLADSLLDRIDPAALGLFFRPVREEALAAGKEALDFGPLFLGLSFFLVVAALILTALLFALGVDRRRAETGTLLALGFTGRRVAALYLGEGLLLSLAGAVAGTLLGVVYTALLLGGLGSIWSGAVAGAPLALHASWPSLVVGGAAGVLLNLAAMAWTLRRQAGRTVHSLLSGTDDEDPGAATRRPARSVARDRRPGLVTAAVAFLAAGLLLVPALAGDAGGGSGAGFFFGAGALLLVGGLGLVHACLAGSGAGGSGVAFTLAGLSRKNAARRRGRSLAAVAVIACGAFLLFAVSANRKNPLDGTDLPGSGTGGFAWVAASALPVLHGLDTVEGARSLGLDARVLAGARVVNIRLRDGDDASCLNLNRARRPPLLGLPPSCLRESRSFTFITTLDGKRGDDPWALLEEELPDGAVPAVADQATILWGLDATVGDTIEYVDDRGKAFRVRLVGALKSSLFQGSLLIGEEDFLARFPTEEGYRLFLVGAPEGRREAVGTALSRSGRNVGLETAPAADRLAAFAAVEETYLSIFQALGGLGLLLGSGGLAFVLLRNMMERRGELALLRAVGFTGADVRRLLFLEHGRLLAAGLLCGTIAACVAVWPALRALGAGLPWLSLGLTFAAVAAGGALAILFAAGRAADRNFLDALRQE